MHVVHLAILFGTVITCWLDTMNGPESSLAVFVLVLSFLQSVYQDFVECMTLQIILPHSVTWPVSTPLCIAQSNNHT